MCRMGLIAAEKEKEHLIGWSVTDVLTPIKSLNDRCEKQLSDFFGHAFFSLLLAHACAKADKTVG